jgi:uncharacterized protein YcaQ
MGAWPYLVGGMRARRTSTEGWAGKLSREEERLARFVLAEIAARGPLTSDDIEHDARALTAWNSGARQVKVVLEKLLLHGRVLITTRRRFRRVYDLPERVLPAAVLSAPEPTRAETQRWSVLTKLRQLRLVRLSRADAKLVADAIQPVRIGAEGAPVYCLREDAEVFERIDGESAASTPMPGRENDVRLLAPLDPLVYDRELARRIWDFDYTWEVYTPPAKRVRGYYALPVLAGTDIVGHVDPKAERETGRLRVVGRRVRRGVASAPAVRELAVFLGLEA